jgi:hypothetical protein
VQGDYSALLSSFAELGLKLQMDMPEDAMAIIVPFQERSPRYVCLSEALSGVGNRRFLYFHVYDKVL